MEALDTGTMSLITGIENLAPDTEIAIMDTRSAAPAIEVVRVPSTSVSTCAAIVTFSGLSAVAKPRLVCSTTCNLVAARVDASAANWRPETSHKPHRTLGTSQARLLSG